MTSDDNLTRYEQRAADLGAEHGRAQGSWVIDGNTTAETAARILKGYEDGDPEILDMAPSPLSGEWADGMTLGRLYADVGIPDDEHGNPRATDSELDVVCEAYEYAYGIGFWDVVVTDAGRFFA